MLTCNPHITEHCYRQAEDRLCAARETLKGFVGATWRDWAQVSTGFLRTQGVNFSSIGSRFYVTTWTLLKCVSFCVSDDNAIRTVLDFEPDVRGRRLLFGSEPIDLSDFCEEPSKYAGDPHADAARKLIGHSDVSPQELICRIVGLSPGALDSPHATPALEAFSQDKIDYLDLRDVLKARRVIQDTLLQSAIKRREGRPMSA